MANKYDLKIATVVLAADDTYEDIDTQVPAGKTRFVCFVKTSIAVATEKIILAESTNVVGGTPAPVYTVKDETLLVVGGTIAYPDKIDVDNPLFSIAEGQYLSVKGDSLGDVVTVVYFDE